MLYVFYQSFLKLITQFLFNAKSRSVFPRFSELSIRNSYAVTSLVKSSFALLGEWPCTYLHQCNSPDITSLNLLVRHCASCSIISINNNLGLWWHNIKHNIVMLIYKIIHVMQYCCLQYYKFLFYIDHEIL